MRFLGMIRLTIPVMAAAVTLTSCVAVDTTIGTGSSAVGISNDINPVDRSRVRDGGNLRLDIGALPDNWNGISNDGNNSEIAYVLWPMMPRAFNSDASGALTVNHDYFTDVQMTGTDPQQVVYTINPKAVWSDGSPITWEDIASQAHSLDQTDRRYLIAMSNGFDRVEKVERGIDDRQAIITFKQHYADWRGQFAGNSMLYPKSVTGTPDAFNNSLVNGITLTSGPFVVRSVDRTQGRIVLSRNPRWWGQRPKLDTITFSVLEADARVTALQNNEIDAVVSTPLSSIDDIQNVRSTPGAVIRRTPSTQFAQLFFNGAPGSILADPKLRVALSKAVDRKGIATALQFGLVENPHPLDNHMFLQGQQGYQDNSGSVAFDPKAAAKELDELGWKLHGDVREKDGRKLVIRDVMYQQDSWVQLAQILQQDFAEIGVKLTIDTRPAAGYFTRVIIPGDFDLAQFSFVGDVFALSSIPQTYALNPGDIQNNFGRIGSPELNALIDRMLSELDYGKALQLANEVDRKVFEEGHSMPLFQSPGNVGIRTNVANLGAPGFASYDYTKIGFLK